MAAIMGYMMFLRRRERERQRKRAERHDRRRLKNANRNANVGLVQTKEQEDPDENDASSYTSYSTSSSYSYSSSSSTSPQDSTMKTAPDPPRPQTIYEQLIDKDQQFFHFTGMSHATFDELFNILQENRNVTNLKPSLKCQDKDHLLLTLRYLVTGDSSQTLHLQFALSVDRTHTIIFNTCELLAMVLRPICMPNMTAEKFREVAQGFADIWKFPHVIGAIGSQTFTVRSSQVNQKDTFLLNLLVVSDAHGIFTNVETGQSKCEMEAGEIFKNSRFGDDLLYRLPIPQAEVEEAFGVKPLPYFFLADQTHPLRVDLQRPYPSRGLSEEKQRYNKKILRALSVVDHAVGIMISKWGVLRFAVGLTPYQAHWVTRACCMLHNFVHRRIPITSDLVEAADVKPNPYMVYCGWWEGQGMTKASLALRNALCDVLKGEKPVEERILY